MNRSVTKLALATIFWSLAWTVSAEEKDETNECDKPIVPASFLQSEACESRARGSECPGYLVWNQEDFFGPCLSDFDRRFVFPHELFHAVQFGYRSFRDLWCCSNGASSTGPGGWLIEGMAEAAALDWADSRGTAYAPAPGTNWRYDGRRAYSAPLHKPSATLSYYATSSFWRFVKRRCGSYAIFKAVLANDPQQVEQCPTVTGEKPESVKPALDFGKRVWFLDENNEDLDRTKMTNYEFALQTAYAYYRDAGSEPPCLRHDPAPDWSSSADFVIHHVEPSTGANESDAKESTEFTDKPQEKKEPAEESRPAICLDKGHGGNPDTQTLKLVDRVLSHFLAKLCSGGKNAGKLEGYCGRFEVEQFGGLAVAYLAFINEFSEKIFTGEIPVSTRETITEVFYPGCVRSENRVYQLDVPELASQCVVPQRHYSTANTYYVIARGPLKALDQLQLGWHGCHAGPLGTQRDSEDGATGEKYWLLKPHVGRPGCHSARNHYTLVFSNVARRAHQTRPISEVTVTIEAQVEGEGN